MWSVVSLFLGIHSGIVPVQLHQHRPNLQRLQRSSVAKATEVLQVAVTARDIGVTKGEVCLDPIGLLLSTWQIVLTKVFPLGTRSGALALSMVAKLRSWDQAHGEIHCLGYSMQVHLLSLWC